MSTDCSRRSSSDGGMQPKPAIIGLARPCMARGTGSSNPFPSAESHTNHRFLARDRGMPVPRRERSESVSGTGTGQGSLSRVAQNALDLCSSDPINLAHLSDRHTILHPRPDAGKLRAWDLARRRRGGDCCFRLIRQDGYWWRDHRRAACVASWRSGPPPRRMAYRSAVSRTTLRPPDALA